MAARVAMPEAAPARSRDVWRLKPVVDDTRRSPRRRRRPRRETSPPLAPLQAAPYVGGFSTPWPASVLGSGEGSEGAGSPDVRAMLAASEGRAMQLVDQVRQEWRHDFADLRDELAEDIERLGSQFMPASRIQERWVADSQHFERLDGQMGALQRDMVTVGQKLPRLATVDDVRQVVREELASHPTTLAVEHMVTARVTEATGKFITAEQVATLLGQQQKAHREEFRTLIAWAVGILVAADALGLIHFASLFGK